jgi:hypothetical protein
MRQVGADFADNACAIMAKVVPLYIASLHDAESSEGVLLGLVDNTNMLDLGLIY